MYQVGVLSSNLLFYSSYLLYFNINILLSYICPTPCNIKTTRLVQIFAQYSPCLLPQSQQAQSKLPLIINQYQILNKMRLSIRLQQHGKKNHPYWWIVVAPQHKNIFGRYTEHIGFWSPRHNVNIKRQVIFNIPRLMYWLANGAIPTPKIHRFLTMFGIFPRKWHYQKSQAQRAAIEAKKKPYQEMTPKEKSLQDRRRKRNERQQLARFQYHRYEAMAYRKDKIKQQFLAKLHAQQFQNEVIRDALMQADLQKYDRLSELANNKLHGKPINEQLEQVKQKLRKAKSELAFIEKQHATSNILQKSKISKTINNLINQINQLQAQNYEVNYPKNAENAEEFITQDYLDKKLQYELVTKKIQKSEQQLKHFHTFFDLITVRDLYEKLKQLKDKNPEMDIYKQLQSQEQIYQLAQELFKSRTQDFAPMTRMDLIALEDDKNAEMFFDKEQDPDEVTHVLTRPQTYINMLLSQGAILPTTQPVHPRPDLKSYIPEEHYDPIDHTKLDILMMDSLEPHEELEKYHAKRRQGESIAQRKARDHKKRMERLRMVTQN